MPKSLTHKFISGIADGADPTLVRPQSNWNDDHNFWLGRRSVAISTDTIAHADHFTIVKYTVACAVSLPAPTGGNMPNGWQTRLVNSGSGTAVTISFTGGATINGSAASVVLNPGDMIELDSDGSADYLGIIETAGAAAAFLQPGVTNTITVGYRFTPNNLGNIGTPFTPNPALGNYQFGINHAAATWNIPANDCAMDILVTNDGTAGAITFSGYAGGLTGDPLTITDKATATVTCTSASPGVITWTAHGLQNGDPVYLTATTSVPAGFTSGTVYYVNNRATNTFELAPVPGGTSINTTSTGSGTITGHACSRFVISIRRINASSAYSVRALQ